MSCLIPSSCPLVGFEWGGWWLVNRVLPFGWKISPFVNQTLGLVATHTLRCLNVPCSQYIDDRHLGQLKFPSAGQVSIIGDPQLARSACYMACKLLTQLGYFLNLEKSVFIPTQRLVFLGLECDSVLQSFHLPEKKIVRFRELRESILKQQQTSITSLQKMIGKCMSFVLVVPGAKLFTREMSIAITQASKRKAFIDVKSPLRLELEHWRFLDTWTDHMPWFDERHVVVRLASDASGFRWGGTLLGDDNKPVKEVGDSWEDHMLSEDIMVKETVALLNTLKVFRNSLQGFRVDAWADNKPLVDSWNGQYSRSQKMLRVLKELFWLTVELKISLNVRYIPSSANPADKPSRRLTVSESMLSPRLWEDVQARYGGSAGHTADLLSLDSNVQRDLAGQPLPHIAPWTTSEAFGVNIFSKRITPGTIYTLSIISSSI